jgi:hypothetical protein
LAWEKSLGFEAHSVAKEGEFLPALKRRWRAEGRGHCTGGRVGAFPFAEKAGILRVCGEKFKKTQAALP